MTTRVVQAAVVEFRNVDRDVLRATVAAVLVGMKKTAQHILMASIRIETPHRGGCATTINLDTDVVETYVN